MKKLLLSTGILICSINAFSQFGSDIIIDTTSSLDQKQVEITSAFNGWLYSAYTTVDSANDQGGITIRRSIDKGITWQTIDSYLPGGVRYEDVDLVVAGTDTSALTLFVAGINHNIGSNTYVAYIDRYDATHLNYLNSPYNKNTGTRTIYDIELTTDYEFPAVGATPYTVALLVSEYSSTYDSITVDVSMDGGTSFTVHQQVAITGGYFKKISLSYGRSASGSNGRLFAAWEQHGSSNSRTGHIYTSRTASTVDGAWITPICLDSVSSTMINLCRNPRIATSFGTTDNDSGSVSAVVLVDRDYNGDASDYDLLGFFNKRAHFTNYWYRLDILNSGENDMQPDIVFDVDSSKFRATYYDSTNQKLAYIHNDWNLVTPSTWTTANTQYNDTTVRTNPYPRLAISRAEHGTAAVWTRKGANNKGIAMFDSEYTSIYLSIDNNQEPVLEISAYPNPTTDYVNIQLDGIENANLWLIDNNGQVIQTYNMVTNNQIIHMGDLATGIYFLKFEHNGKSVTKKIIKN